MRVLVIEDEAEIVELLQLILDSVPEVACTFCRTLDEGRAAVDDGLVPDAALVDFSATGRGTSVDLCRHILDRAPNCKLHLMGGMCRETMQSAADNVVAIDTFIEKPFTAQQIIDRMAGCGRQDGRRTLGLTQYPQATNGQMEMLQKLLERDPSDVGVRQLLGFSYYTAGRYVDAVAEYDAVVEAGGATYLSEYYAGQACARMHDLQRAIARWLRAAELAPGPEARAKVQARISQAEEMLRVERKMFDSSPSHPKV